MALQVFFNIRHLELPLNFKIITPIFNITNSIDEKKQLIADEFLTAIGLKASQAYHQQTIGYATIEGDELDDKQKLEMSRQLLTKSNTMKTFLLFLWFIKDNSISLEETYGNFEKLNQLLQYNSHSLNSTAEGVFKDVIYEEEELKRAVDLVLQYTKLCPARPEEITGFDQSDTGIVSQLSPGFPRDVNENKLERAMAFLNTARSTSHVPQKITHYMSVLETLFSTDSAEATQKVSERTAFYLGSDRVSRLVIFNDVKKAYGTRSQFVHGQKIKLKYPELAQQASKVDKIIRQVLTRIITTDHSNFLNDKNACEKFLTELIF